MLVVHNNQYPKTLSKISLMAKSSTDSIHSYRSFILLKYLMEATQPNGHLVCRIYE